MWRQEAKLILCFCGIRIRNKPARSVLVSGTKTAMMRTTRNFYSWSGRLHDLFFSFPVEAGQGPGSRVHLQKVEATNTLSDRLKNMILISSESLDLIKGARFD